MPRSVYLRLLYTFPSLSLSLSLSRVPSPLESCTLTFTQIYIYTYTYTRVEYTPNDERAALASSPARRRSSGFSVVLLGRFCNALLLLLLFSGAAEKSRGNDLSGTYTRDPPVFARAELSCVRLSSRLFRGEEVRRLGTVRVISGTRDVEDDLLSNRCVSFTGVV